MPAAGELSGRYVLLGVSGGIAAYKAASLARALIRGGATVQAILTQSAAQFIGPATFEGLTGRSAHHDAFSQPERILHVEFAREADVAVFAPATANLLAKFAHGLADDLVTSTFACLTCPVVIAPAMHTEMWLHPATQANVELLVRRGARIVGPAEGDLAGGDIGPGRLADEDDILTEIARGVGRTSAPHGHALGGRRVVVTAGGTREPIDPVRFIGNRSSGKMGYALAAEAARRGALVDLVSAPTHLADPPGVTIHRVETALQMRDAVLGLAEKADVIIKAAAVADFRPTAYHQQKLKKGADDFTSVTLERNPDILAELGEAKNGRLLVGFAAETDLEEERGREKLHRKGLDLIVINRVDMADAGFAVDTNRAVLLTADGERTEVPLTTKAELAAVICDQIDGLLARG
ncbi:MAG TPA: bifunctional phosphopantothenoylcysteine decarboxylase/phosphopantothenate--cysteine ligase CoaBC [Egibacteraceae bacterium]|nr:bifunctional phosphopantothenoylcysteine decarboxylase/phosphopantothenate--cysteine ligase CoaBC [Egibacteraceae bacterium]